MNQLNLFTDKQCAYCGHGEPKPGNPDLWNGFMDQDTGDLVCFKCKTIHYISKAKRMGTFKVDLTKHAGAKYLIESMTYSEMPVMNKEYKHN